MPKIFDAADSRGLADHGWLVSRHTFSFADYMNPQRMGFGLLRVLNDDIVAASRGFGAHSHANMEIISIPLSGSLKHQDSMGNQHVISAGEIQIMSAGSGITHSEYNNSTTDAINFLQIWVMPDQRDIKPRYDQQRMAGAAPPDSFQLVVAPIGEGGLTSINQDAWFSMATLDAGATPVYKKHKPANGVYFFLIAGKVSVNGDELKARDGLGMSDVDDLQIKASESSTLLVMEIPMR